MTEDDKEFKKDPKYIYLTWNLKSYEGYNLKYIWNNFKNPLKYDYSLSFFLTDSCTNKLNTNTKIYFKSTNILLWNFIGLENTIEQLYLPLFIAMKTNAKNIYIGYSKTKRFWRMYNNGILKPIKKEEINIKSIDTFINPREDINKNNFLHHNNIRNIFGKYIPKNIINLNYGNYKCILKNMYIQPNLNNCILFRGVCPFKSNYLWNNAKKWNEKENYLVYPATFNNANDKNQLEFAKLLDKNSLGNYTILFTGNQKKHGSNEYLKNTESILKKKNIKYKIECINDDIYTFMDILLKSKGLIFYGVLPVDRVRVLTEGLFANLPFIVNDAIKTIPDLYCECGFKVKNNNAKDLNDKIKQLINIDWGFKPLLLTKQHFQIDKIAEKIIEEINTIIK